MDELNIQDDHVHLIIGVPPKLLISTLMGILKGRTQQYECLRSFRILKESLIGEIIFGLLDIVLIQ